MCNNPLSLISFSFQGERSSRLARTFTSFFFIEAEKKMQRVVRAVRSCQDLVEAAMLQHSHWRPTAKIEKMFSHFGRVTSSPSAQEKGLENVTVSEVLIAKEGENAGSWLWCHSSDTVTDAVKHVCCTTCKHDFKN